MKDIIKSVVAIISFLLTCLSISEALKKKSEIQKEINKAK